MNSIESLFSLKGKTALITGGGTGLGRDFARTLAAAGAKVILAARRLEKLEQTVTELAAAGFDASALTLDVTDRTSVDALFARCAQIGVIDILVNNAGIIGTPSLLDVSEEEWHLIINTNLSGSWRVARGFVTQLSAAKRGGRIINISSLLAVSAQKGTAPYAASKAALLQLTRSMAIEWARYGINVNAIMPGYIATDIAEDFLQSDVAVALQKRIPLRRLGDPADLRGAMLLLAAPAGAYMTGSVVTVDGGHSMPQPL